MLNTHRNATLAVVLALALTACGGSESSTPTPTPTPTPVACSPAGAWTLAFAFGTPSNANCASFNGTASDSPVGIAVNGTVLAWEDPVGKDLAGTFDAASCAGHAVILDGPTTIGTDSAGAPITSTITWSFAVTFSGTQITGTGTVTNAISANAPPAMTGFPCSVPFTITGKSAL